MTMRSRLLPFLLLAACGSPPTLTDAGAPPGSTIDAATGAIVPTATGDVGSRSATADSPTTLGDWALTSCVSLVSDADLVLQGTAHLRVVRQCDAAPASGHVGGGVDTTDPVVWSDAAEDGGAGLGT